MPNKMFQGVFDSDYVSVIPIEKFLLCIIVSLFIGGCIAFTVSRGKHMSLSFITTMLTLPVLSCAVIMMVNGNVGIAVATAGTFNLVHFRSAAGSAKEMAFVFLCMVSGLISGMGYLAYAVLFTLVLCIVFWLINLFDPSIKNLKKRLRITVPEDLNYTGIFYETLSCYCKNWKLIQVKTINMGALFRLTYDVCLRDSGKEKDFIDELRMHNGNLEISLAEAESTESDL